MLLLTTPSATGYIQNPISVYYCFDKAGALQQCIAEVTNTPWGGRVVFLFEPQGASVPKSLHVSPMMDMQGTWYVKCLQTGCCCVWLRVVGCPTCKNLLFFWPSCLTTS